ncbi:ABC transporter permease [Xinfangfangia sp. D13-10-4-6]|uniref:ABC transporter permease n=1 Tax=Pseudogemmobacter hezensis TaxID=2737662 RepID=UPI001555A35C|nr:ABC transporter permease [Pseudogemmobacter hezensis]NPD16750.1 ABC transporter permease [Pseudogemmobacter hezensis]
MFLIRRGLALASPGFLLVLTLGFLPLAIILVWSFWTWDPATYWIRPDFSFDAYAQIGEAGRWHVILSSLGKAALAGVLCLLVGYPAALAIHFVASRPLAFVLMGAFTVPFFTSYLIRAFSWRLVLGRNGLINSWLLDLGLISEPLDWLLFSNFAVMVGLVASYLPFVIFPLLLSMRRVEPNFIAASQDLGAGFLRTLFTVIIPLTKPGIFAGFLFVFVMAAGSSTEVQMLGGAGASMISIIINDVMRVVNFPLAFAISAVVLVLLFAAVLIGNRIFGLTKLFEDFK